jgi:thymidylate synthase
MKEILVREKTLARAYHKALVELAFWGEIIDCPDYGQKQKECSMTIVVGEPLSEPMISKLYPGGFEELEQYRQEILYGILDFLIGHGWDYTYHDRIKDQLPFIYQELKRNPESRRAVIDVRDWRQDTKEGNTSPACLQNIQYFVRGGKLHCKVLMRSNDAPKAAFMNMFAFIMLQQQVAQELNLDMGTYTHRSNSFHCYERDFELLENYKSRIIREPYYGDSLAYDYKGFFEELMIESRPKIYQKVCDLKRQKGVSLHVSGH